MNTPKFNTWKKSFYYACGFCRFWIQIGYSGKDKRWDGWMASPMQWTWTLANLGRWCGGTGNPGMLQSVGSQRVGHDLVTEQQQNSGKDLYLLQDAWSLIFTWKVWWMEVTVSDNWCKLLAGPSVRAVSWSLSMWLEPPHSTEILLGNLGFQRECSSEFVENALFFNLVKSYSVLYK